MGDIHVNVRWAELKDIHDLYNIYNNDGEKHARPLESYSIANWLAGENKIFLVAELSKIEKVGFIIARPMGKEARIDFFSVLKDAAIKEVREALIDRAMELLPNTKLSVYVQDKKGKIKFYESLGFEIIEISHNMYGEGKDGIYLMKQPNLRKKTKVVYPQTVVGELLEENLKKLEMLGKAKEEE
jgi:ribosomal protein S18 acetylase RimI-like enzyme